MRDLGSESQTKDQSHFGVGVIGLKPSRLTGTFVPGIFAVLIRTAEIHDGPNSLPLPVRSLLHTFSIDSCRVRQGTTCGAPLGDQKEKNMIENGSAAENPRRIVNTVLTGKVSVPTGSGPLHAPAYRCVDKGRRPG